MSNQTSLAKDLIKKLRSLESKTETGQTGEVLEIADGVAKVSGLHDLKYSEMVEFPGGIKGVAINLEEDEVGVIILGDYLGIKEGDKVKGTGLLLSVGVSEKLIGRVIDPLGNAIDGKEKVKFEKFNPIEKLA